MHCRYLLDTNIASYIIKGNFPAVRRHLVRHAMPEIAISSVTEGELCYGVARRPDATGLLTVVDEFLREVTILTWDSDAARQYGQLRAALERIGQPMGSLDMMIGAHALASALILVTNARAFGRVKGLKVQDWTRP